MNRLALAIAAGAGAFALAMVAFTLALIVGLASSSDGPTVTEWAILATLPALMALGGTLPLRTLGLPWGRSLAIALGAHYGVAALWFAAEHARTQPFAIGAPTSIPPDVAVPIVIAAAITMAVGAYRAGTTRARPLPTGILAVACALTAIALSVSIDETSPLGTVPVLFAWLALPAVAIAPRGGHPRMLTS